MKSRLLGLLATAVLLANLACGGGSGSAPPPKTPPTVQSFSASPNPVYPGEQVTLSWTVTGNPTVSISGIGSVQGTSIRVHPTVTTTYELTAQNGDGSATARVTVQMDPHSPPPVISFFSATLLAGGHGSSQLNVLPGEPVWLAWEVSGATQLSVSGVGAVDYTYWVKVTPAATTTYTLTASNGISSSTASVTVFVPRALNLVAMDMVFSPLTNRLYASVPDLSGGSSDAIVVIDPNTTAVVGRIPVGRGANAMALSSDGGTLYVELAYLSSIQKIDLRTDVVSAPFPIWEGDSTQSVGSMVVLPGLADSIAVARVFIGMAGGAPQGVTIYDNGIPRPVSFSDNNHLVGALQAGTNPDLLYGYNNYTMEFGLCTLEVKPTGVTLLNSMPRAAGDFFQQMTFSEGNLYFTTGEVVDAVDLTSKASFYGGGAVLPDPASGLTYFATTDGRLNLFDSASHTPAGYIELNFTAQKLALTGPSGLALLGDGRILFLRTPLPRIPSLSASHGEVASGQSVSLQFETTGASSLSMNSMVDGGGWGILGPMPMNGMTQVQPVRNTTYILRAANGEICASAKINIVAQPGLAQASMGLITNDIVYSPLTQRFYASIPSRVGKGGNTLATIDPSTGEVISRLSVGCEPGQLALADDNRTLYVALGSVGAIQQVDLVTNTLGPLLRLEADPDSGPRYPLAIAAMPGSPNSLLVSRVFAGIYSPAGVAIYDAGVARPLVASQNAPIDWFQFSADGKTIYGVEEEAGDRTNFMSHSPSGVTIESSISTPPYDCIYASNRLYFPFGYIYDATTGNQIQANQPSLSNAPAGAVLPSVETGLIYYGSNGSLQAFDVNGFAPRGSYPLGYQFIASAVGDRLLRWGQDGLLLLKRGSLSFPGEWVSSGQIFIFKTSDIK